MLNYILLLCLAVAVCEQRKPNFVVIITDDQDAVLEGMTPMTNVRRLIADEGVTFSNSYTTSPICCPSRASLLTGRYVHNHGTTNNSMSGGCYGERWRRLERSTVATVLSAAGYNTFYAGKYLNQYGAAAAGGAGRVPPGWGEWRALLGNSVYYDYTISNDGVPTYSSEDYLTDVIRDVAVSFVQRQSGAAPFLAVVAPPAPHQPATPAPRHRGRFANVSAPRSPAFNVPAPDKHWLLRMPPSPLPERALPALDALFRARWEALLAVDELVAAVVGALDAAALLDDTYLIYTSDNGYHIGQFSQVYDKRQPYETDIKVPLLIRGPSVLKNITNPSPVVNIDLAPTIIHLAGLGVPEDMDGKPIDINSESLLERNMLIEYYGEGSDSTVDGTCPWKYDGGRLSECYPQYECKCQDSKNNTFACVRHLAPPIDTKYCLFADDDSFVEMYDLASDPHELRNAADATLPAVRHHYRAELARLLHCGGADCHRDLTLREVDSPQ